MNSFQLLLRRLRRWFTGAFAANPETHDCQGLIKMCFGKGQPISARHGNQVRTWGSIFVGSTSRPQTGGQALANEASIEGRFSYAGKKPDLRR